MAKTQRTHAKTKSKPLDAAERATYARAARSLARYFSAAADALDAEHGPDQGDHVRAIQMVVGEAFGFEFQRVLRMLALDALAAASRAHDDVEEALDGLRVFGLHAPFLADLKSRLPPMLAAHVELEPAIRARAAWMHDGGPRPNRKVKPKWEELSSWLASLKLETLRAESLQAERKEWNRLEKSAS